MGDDDSSPATTTRKAFWRSASWSASRTSSSSSNGHPPPLTPRSQSKSRSSLLPPLSISRRSLDDWPHPGSDDLGQWPPLTPTTKPTNHLNIDLSSLHPPTTSHKNQLALFDKECSKVADHIYLGGDSVAKNRDILRLNRITHVLNCVGFVCPEYFKSDLTYKTLWLQDSPSEDITSILYDVFDYFEDVRQQTGRVFVHCCQGVSRSTSLVIAYLMWRKGQSFDDAFQFVKAARGIANPNMGFACQLLQCQKRVHAIPLSPNSVVRMYRMAPHSSYDPLHLVPKLLNEASADGLDSRGAFIIHVVSSIYVWIGKECEVVMEKDAKAAAFQVVRYERVPGPILTVEEGEEPAEFWELFSIGAGSDEVGNKPGVGKRRVESYDGDFELLCKAITGGVVPPFPSSGPGQETHLPARESNWSILRRKFISGTICRVYSDSAIVKETDPCGNNRVQILTVEASVSPPYLSPSSISSDSSVSSKCCSESPSISPSTCSSPSLTPSPASNNLPELFVPQSRPSLQISKSFEPLKPSMQAACLPSKGLARSIAERRGSFSLKLPLNKDASLLSRKVMNESPPACVENTQEVATRGNCDDTSRAGALDSTNSEGEAPECLESHADVQSHDLAQKNETTTSKSVELGNVNLETSNLGQPLVYRWPHMEKLATFGREDLHSKAVMLFLTPKDGRDGELGRMLVLWIGSSYDQGNGNTQLMSCRDVDSVTEVDWSQVGCDFLALMGLPDNLPIKVVKNQEPEKFLDFLNSASLPVQ